jgi:hypothetical protein
MCGSAPNAQHISAATNVLLAALEALVVVVRTELPKQGECMCPGCMLSDSGAIGSGPMVYRSPAVPYANFPICLRTLV